MRQIHVVHACRRAVFMALLLFARDGIQRVVAPPAPVGRPAGKQNRAGAGKPAVHRKLPELLVLMLALCQALLRRRVLSGGTSTAVRASTARCESEPSNVTTTSSCHLQVPFAPCQRVDAASKSTRLPRGPSGCSVASVTASGMMLTPGGCSSK